MDTLSYEDIEVKNIPETAETIIPGLKDDGYDFDFFLDLVRL